MAANLPNLANLGYVGRVNRGVDYVLQNLAEPLRLDDVARAAGFSPYHFHRIFRAQMGETLGSFITRVRLERSLYLLSHRSRATLTSIAAACGFSSSSDFSRVFRAHYGVSPRRFDLDRFRLARRATIGTSASDTSTPEDSRAFVEKPQRFAVAVRRLSPRRVAYIRVHQPYVGDRVRRAAARLVAWADARGLADGQWLGYQWDDPEIVPLNKCRYDVGLEVPDGVAAMDEVSVTSFSGIQVAEIDIKGPLDLELRALQWLFFAWLPSSGYAPAHQPIFEAWEGRPFQHGHVHFELRIQLPIVDAAVPL